VIPVVAYIVCAVQRLGTPIELEWMEGGSLQMMYRVLSGKPLYAPTSIEFVPYTYTPTSPPWLAPFRLIARQQKTIQVVTF
jgi:hypothetical protein